jgi:hydroxyacylglutathione hydrolase
MTVETYTVGPFAENTYLLTEKGKALLVDPGFFDPGEFSQFSSDLKEEGIELIAVLLTHAHVDHVLGLEKVLKEYDVPVYLNHSDLNLWENFPDQALRFGFRASGFDFTPKDLAEQKNLAIGPFTMDVLYTPGHSPDHVSLWFADEKVVIAGDALFRESIGRTDLYKGDFDLLAKSIREKLYTLPDETRVLPGHGPATTIGYEKANNAFVKAL